MKRAAERLECFAVAAPGLEPVLREEVQALGLRGRETAGGVVFEGTHPDLYRANLELRTATRILVRAATFHATAFYELEKRARTIPWGQFIAPGRPVSFRVSSHASKLYHQGAIAERLMDAATRAGAAPAGPPHEQGEDAEGEDAQLLVVRVARDRFVISADSSGAPLHRRGYRQAVVKAPLRETLAAAMLLSAGWDPATPLIDPMCGSGTIPIEAALLARRVPPGLAGDGLVAREYAFQRWTDYDASAWAEVVAAARDGALASAPAPILGSDRDAGAIRAAGENAARAGVLADLELDRAPVSELKSPASGATAGWLVTNPPYGKRVGDPGPLRDLYATLGRVARARLPGWTVALLSADARLERQVGLVFQTAFQSRNGGIPVRCQVALVPARVD